VTFQDEDDQYAYVDSAYVQLTSFWHQYTVNLAVPYRLRGHNIGARRIAAVARPCRRLASRAAD
jgi:hypothetical protein